jgi:segregation and condensation protein B
MADTSVTEPLTEFRVPCSDPSELSRVLEALLFVADGPVTEQSLAQALSCEPAMIAAGLDALQERLATTGIRLQRFRDRVQLVSAPELAPAVERFLGLDLSSKLSAAALEVLSIIAYRQPVTRVEIDLLRGVNSGGTLRTLVQRELIEEVGRLETVGHPILYGTSFQFLQYFGLKSLDELPPLQPDEAAKLLTELQGNDSEPLPATAPGESHDPAL